MRQCAFHTVLLATGCALLPPSCGRIGYDPLGVDGGRHRNGLAGPDGSTAGTGIGGDRTSSGAGGDSGRAALDASTDGIGGASGAPSGSGGAASGGAGASTSGAAGTGLGSGGGLDGGAGGAVSGGTGGADASATRVTIVVAPVSTNLLVGSMRQFAAEVTGSPDTRVAWSIAEGAAGGAIAATGLYSAPAVPGVFHVVVTSVADPSKRATARVTVSRAASGSLGVWQDVTPPGLDATKEFGLSDVLVDPARPSDLYAFACDAGVWRSTDYGVQWSKVSTGAGAAVLDTGCPSTAAIDSNPARDPLTPPTLYSGNVHGQWRGVEKSADGGVSWSSHALPAPLKDVSGLDTDPYDGLHLLAATDAGGGFAESFDGGETWNAIAGLPAVMAGTVPFFVDTGLPSTTRATWLAISGGGGTVGGQGTWRTTNGGESWTQVDTFGHGGGTAQLFQTGAGAMYTGGQYGSQGGASTLGIYASTDYGGTWNMVSSGSANGAVGTATYVYGWNDWPNPGGIYPGMRRAPLASGSPWTAVTTPAAMTNGPKRAAVTYDGTHFVIVGGCWNAGLFRYVEP